MDFGKIFMRQGIGCWAICRTPRHFPSQVPPPPWAPSTGLMVYRVTQKKLHELDRLYLLDSKRYEDKQGVSV